jgi:hypothetical protein
LERRLVVLFSRQLEILARVGKFSFQLLDELDLTGGSGAFAQQVLSLLLVVPELWCSGKLIEFLYLAFELRNVKDAPLAPEHASGDLQVALSFQRAWPRL